jgi:hypothetical protein
LRFLGIKVVGFQVYKVSKNHVFEVLGIKILREFLRYLGFEILRFQGLQNFSNQGLEVSRNQSFRD